MVASVRQMQAISGGLATSPTFTISSATLTTSKLACIVGSGQTFPVTALTDNGTGGANTWTRTLHNSGTLLGDIWETLAAAPHAITTITATTGGNELVNILFFEIAGAINTSALDVSVSAQQTTATAASSGSSAPLNQINDLVIGATTWLRSNSTSNFNSDQSFTAGAATAAATVDNAGVSANHWSTSGGWRILSTTAAQTFTTTVISPSFSVTVLAGIKAATGMKTADGLVKASVKTRSGLGTGLVKTWNGLT